MIMRILIILGVAFLIMNLEGCKHGVPDFPVSSIYYFEHESQYCIRYQIVSQNPIKLGEPETLEREECPAGVMGVDADSIAKTRDWVREMQKSWETCK
jgi:hypothetical protein